MSQLTVLIALVLSILFCCVNDNSLNCTIYPIFSLTILVSSMILKVISIFFKKKTLPK